MLGVVNEKALHELGWGQLCSELAARARTPMGRGRCEALLPGQDEDAARQRLLLVEEARLLHRHDRELPLADAVDVRPSLGRAAREGTLEPIELLQVARLIRASDSARRFVLLAGGPGAASLRARAGAVGAGAARAGAGARLRSRGEAAGYRQRAARRVARARPRAAPRDQAADRGAAQGREDRPHAARGVLLGARGSVRAAGARGAPVAPAGDRAQRLELGADAVHRAAAVVGARQPADHRRGGSAGGGAAHPPRALRRGRAAGRGAGARRGSDRRARRGRGGGPALGRPGRRRAGAGRRALRAAQGAPSVARAAAQACTGGGERRRAAGAGAGADHQRSERGRKDGDHHRRRALRADGSRRAAHPGGGGVADAAVPHGVHGDRRRRRPLARSLHLHRPPLGAEVDPRGGRGRERWR